jgi:hypothetical protein
LWRFLKHLQHPIELTRTRRQISAKFIEARRESADASRRRVTDQQIQLVADRLQTNHQATSID